MMGALFPADIIKEVCGDIARRPINAARQLIAVYRGADFYIDYDNKVRATRDIKEGEAIEMTPEQHRLLIEEQLREEHE